MLFFFTNAEIMFEKGEGNKKLNNRRNGDCIMKKMEKLRGE